MRRILLALAIGLTVIALPGVTFAVSDEETVRLLKRDADQRNPNAQGRLGYFYETGRGGLAKDDREAARLYRLAADRVTPPHETISAGFTETAVAASPKTTARLCASSSSPPIRAMLTDN
jgi:hypothetical protein